MRSISNRLIGSNAGKGALLAVAFALGLMTLGTAARAESVRIVAMGASNTAGQAVGAAAAWPALLESMLKAKGYDINFSVAGVVGDTSAGIASRVDSAVPNGTKVVLFDVGGGNDKDRGLAMGASRGEIVARIKGRAQSRSKSPMPRSSGPKVRAMRPGSRATRIITSRRNRTRRWRPCCCRR